MINKKYVVLGIVILAAVLIAGCIGQNSSAELNITAKYSGDGTQLDESSADTTGVDSSSSDIVNDSTPTSDQEVPDY